MLAIPLIFGVGLARGLFDGRYLAGLAGLPLDFGSADWILSLFKEALAEQ